MKRVTERLSQAVTLHQRNQLDAAEKIYLEILEDYPRHADTHHLIGLICHEKGDNQAALAKIERAIGLNSTVSLYHVNLARVLSGLGRDSDAVFSGRRAFDLDPMNADNLSDLAGALIRTDQPEQALEYAIRALTIQPDLEPAKQNLASAHFEIGVRAQGAENIILAEYHYRAACKTDPNLVEALVNLGNVLRLQLRLEASLACYQAALKINPSLPEAYGNLGVVTQEMGDAGMALTYYNKALSIDPNNPEIRRNRSQALLKSGNFEEGWREFEWRWQTRHFKRFIRHWSKPRWGGHLLKGQTLLIHAEQGFGDTLQFARYLPLVAARGARVIVECPEPLQRLVASIDGVTKTCGFSELPPQHDYQLPMMSLPGVFGTTFENIVNEVPYLRAIKPEVEKWHCEINRGSAGFKIGIAWKGSANHQRNSWRSPGLSSFGKLFKIPGIRWFSLQKDDEDTDLLEFQPNLDLIALGSSVRDFADTAAVIENLDLVISPDTALAHLAGALGHPIWLILPYASEWRWFEDRKKSPWYPSMQLFHQPTRDDWVGAVDLMAQELEQLIL